MFIIKLLTLITLILFKFNLFAQQKWIPDTLSELKSNEKYDIVLNRGFLISNGMNDSVPVNSATSGTTSFAFSLHQKFDSLFSFNYGFGISVLKLDFKQTATKTYPTTQDSSIDFDYQRMRSLYFDIPIAVRLVISRDEKRRVSTFVDLGFYAGRFLGASQKDKYTDFLGKKRIIKSPKLEGLNPWRLGLYARINYKWIGLWVNYRISNMFLKNSNYTNVYGQVLKHPKVNSLEFGISLVL